MGYDLIPAAIDWTDLTSGLTGELSTAAGIALPVAGVVIGATVVFRFIKRLVKG